MRDMKFKAYWNHVDMLQRDARDAERERHCARRSAEKVEQLERAVRECQIMQTLQHRLAGRRGKC